MPHFYLVNLEKLHITKQTGIYLAGAQNLILDEFGKVNSLRFKSFHYVTDIPQYDSRIKSRLSPLSSGFRHSLCRVKDSETGTDVKKLSNELVNFPNSKFAVVELAFNNHINMSPCNCFPRNSVQLALLA